MSTTKESVFQIVPLKILKIKQTNNKTTIDNIILEIDTSRIVMENIYVIIFSYILHHDR